MRQMAESAAVLQEICGVSQVCGISERVTCTLFISNKGFNSLVDFGVRNRDMVMLEMVKFLACRAVATHMNLGTVQIKGLQYLVRWNHDQYTHNQPLVAAEFCQDSKNSAMTEKQIDK